MRFKLVEVGEGRVVFEGTPGADVYNPVGTVHGGYAATLLNLACDGTVHSKLTTGQSYTTPPERRLSQGNDGSDGTREGKIVTFGRRAAFVETKLTDLQGRLLASATSSLLIISS